MQRAVEIGMERSQKRWTSINFSVGGEILAHLGVDIFCLGKTQKGPPSLFT